MHKNRALAVSSLIIPWPQTHAIFFVFIPVSDVLGQIIIVSSQRNQWKMKMGRKRLMCRMKRKGHFQNSEWEKQSVKPVPGHKSEWQEAACVGWGDRSARRHWGVVSSSSVPPNNLVLCGWACHVLCQVGSIFWIPGTSASPPKANAVKQPERKHYQIV